MHTALCDGDSVVITPRAAASSSRYQLTRIDAQSASVVDSLVLPSSMKPLEAGYGDTGFMFSFEAIYNFGEGIANLGTYIPASTVQPDTNAEGNASYSLVPWFRHGVTPTAPPAWCGGWIIAKDSYNVCGFNPESKQYFLLEVKSGAPSFGDYLASTGSVKRVVTYSNIDNTTLQGRIAAVLLRARLGTGLATLKPAHALLTVGSYRMPFSSAFESTMATRSRAMRSPGTS